jgi:hypothetical protein
VREHTKLMIEQSAVEEITLVPDLDMAGARGSAIAAATWVTSQNASLECTRQGLR